MNVEITDAKDVSLHIFKSLPEFTGERSQYATWRTMTKTAMKLLENHKETMRYFEALMIIRNKVTGAASTTLNNYNTAFNFEAIIDRLDFTYADKRPLYILEQELQVLQQNKLTLDEFYDKVNEKLNCIVNKINMTYKEKHTAMAFIEEANKKALRTFITGLNNRRGEILYASNPSSLPEAYARLQTIINDQARITFANRFNQRDNEKEKGYEMRNPQFKFKDTLQHATQSSQNVRSSPKFAAPEPMEIDKSSMSTLEEVRTKARGNSIQLLRENLQKPLRERANLTPNSSESTRSKVKLTMPRRLLRIINLKTYQTMISRKIPAQFPVHNRAFF